MPRKRQPYRGVLAEPIEVPPPNAWDIREDAEDESEEAFTAASERARQKVVRSIITAREQKLAALAEHYGSPKIYAGITHYLGLTDKYETDWKRVALAIAQEHVPGFRLVEEGHSKPCFDSAHRRRFLICIRVHRIMRAEGLGPQEACNRLAAEHPDYRGRTNAAALYKSFQRGRSRTDGELVAFFAGKDDWEAKLELWEEVMLTRPDRT